MANKKTDLILSMLVDSITITEKWAILTDDLNEAAVLGEIQQIKQWSEQFRLIESDFLVLQKEVARNVPISAGKLEATMQSLEAKGYIFAAYIEVDGVLEKALQLDEEKIAEDLAEIFSKQLGER